MLRYRFANYLECGAGDERWASALARAYAERIRPACLCRPSDPPAMYIAATKTGHVIKRMPNTGPQHDPRCEHYEAPAELSGLGQVVGSAIREDPDRDTTTLAFDFALTKGTRRAPADTEAVEHDSVRADGKKLTLRATLHYLLDQARLTRWVPQMEGKRSWAVVRRELIAAAANKVAKGQDLNDLLFIPEPFRLEDKDAIAARRAAKLARLNAASASRMLLVGELKDVESARFGHHLIVKHLPDFRLRVSDDLQKRLLKHFKYQIAMDNELRALAGAHLLVIGTFSQPMQGIYDLEEACLVNVTSSFLPFESMQEAQLLQALVGRRFTKALRYNLPSQAPMATAILHDSERPTALYLVAPGAPEAVAQAITDLAASSPLEGWIWNGRQAVMPALPAPAAAASAGERGSIRPTPPAIDPGVPEVSLALFDGTDEATS
jgi:hypothetical protein